MMHIKFHAKKTLYTLELLTIFEITYAGERIINRKKRKKGGSNFLFIVSHVPSFMHDTVLILGLLATLHIVCSKHYQYLLHNLILALL